MIMPIYFCETCGETEDFKGFDRFTQTVEEEVYIDSTGEIHDWSGYSETIDTEFHEIVSVACNCCGDNLTEFFDRGELLSTAIELGLTLTSYGDEISYNDYKEEWGIDDRCVNMDDVKVVSNWEKQIK